MKTHLWSNLALWSSCSTFYQQKVCCRMKSLWVCQGNWHRQKSPELKASRCLSVLLKLPINNSETNTQQWQQKTPMQQPTLLWTSNFPSSVSGALCFRPQLKCKFHHALEWELWGSCCKSYAITNHLQKQFGTWTICYEYYHHHYCPRNLVIK